MKERQERAKQDRERYKEANKKLSLEEICARTPTKECRKCKNTLSTFNNFYRDHTRFDGLNRLCKECCKKNSSKQRELKKLQNGRKFSETTY